MNRETVKSMLWLVIGSALLIFLGWRWNIPGAAWLAPIFLMRFFRTQTRWQVTLVALVMMTTGLFFNLTGSWDFTIGEEIAISLARALPIFAALTIDRAFHKKLRPLPGSLLFPAILVVIDYLIAFSPLGTVFTLGATQFTNPALVQVASLTGVWGLTFLIGWAASIVNLAWEADFRLRAVSIPVGITAALFAGLLLWGGGRLSMSEPASETVRVAAVTVEHPRDYYVAVDQFTPRELAQSYQAETEQLNDDLFVESERAAETGAKIIFWSEENAVLYPENRAAFVERAQTFAKDHGIYLIPAYMVFRYGEASVDNQLMIITPEGEVADTYTKTKSWYPTDSDGRLPVVSTPYGTLSAAICFDLDFPGFVHQVASRNVDIMIDPSYDWEPIKPYHTYVGLLRGIENGFAVVRHVNEGTSIAIDAHGQVLAYQDYFDTANRVMIVDVPTRGVRTLYGLLGDWFAYVAIAYMAVTILWVLLAGRVSPHTLNDRMRRMPEPSS